MSCMLSTRPNDKERQPRKLFWTYFASVDLESHQKSYVYIKNNSLEMIHIHIINEYIFLKQKLRTLPEFNPIGSAGGGGDVSLP